MWMIVIHSQTYLTLQKTAGVAFVVVFVALVMRVPIRREAAISRGEPPMTLTFRRFRPAKSNRWWLATHVVKSPRGWQRLERFAVWFAWTGAGVFVVTVVLGVALHPR